MKLAAAAAMVLISACGLEYHKPTEEDGWYPTVNTWCTPEFCVEPGESGLLRGDVDFVFKATLDAFEAAELKNRHRQIHRERMSADMVNARLYIMLVVNGTFVRPGGCSKKDPESKCGGLYHADTRLLEVAVTPRSFDKCMQLAMLPHELLHAFIQIGDPELFYSHDGLGMRLVETSITPHPKAFFDECGSAEWEARRLLAIETCGFLDLRCTKKQPL